MMMKVGTEVIRKYDLRRLRFIASVGEPLNPEAVVWGKEAFGLPIHDNWRQTETGGIMIANYASMDIRPGSMGRPLPGIEAAIVQHRPDKTVEVLPEAGVQGELALRPGWPSMFRGYLNEAERYRTCFAWCRPSYRPPEGTNMATILVVTWDEGGNADPRNCVPNCSAAVRLRSAVLMGETTYRTQISIEGGVSGK
jgi:acyl-CoA synthetase (AMP-forming)/AMP-acid ligase II